MRLIILFLTFLIQSTIARSNSIKCDEQSNKSQTCELTNRFYDFESWQIEGKPRFTSLIITDLQSETLPTALAESFLNLVTYSTSETTFKSVKKENFRNLKKLQTLKINNGQLTRIRRDSFEDLESLLHLDLGNNMIKLMSAEYFREMGRLEFLTFNNNEVEEISPRTFKNLLNLKEINANDNQIYVIEKGTFESNQKLRNISFKGNQLRFIDSSTFNGLNELKTVDFSENQCIDKKFLIDKKNKNTSGMLKSDVSEFCQHGIKF